MNRAVDVVVIRRRVVPQAIGLILPLGLIKGMTLALASASRTSVGTLLPASCVSVVARASRAGGLLCTMA